MAEAGQTDRPETEGLQGAAAPSGAVGPVRLIGRLLSVADTSDSEVFWRRDRLASLALGYRPAHGRGPGQRRSSRAARRCDAGTRPVLAAVHRVVGPCRFDSLAV